MGCCTCCTKADATCRKVMEPFMAILRVLENVPIIGHLIASIYACSSCKDRAERAGLKATMGLALAVCNCPAEAVDESVRHRSPKLMSYRMTPRPDWMKNYKRRTLRHLCMPASHQSATYAMDRKLEQIPMVEGWSRCQDLSIDAQLYGGVRLLDLRLMTYEGEIWTHHQKVLCVKLKEILDTLRDFIAEQPSEVVFLYISNDGKDLDWMKVHSLLNEYIGKKLIPEHMREMAIGDIVQYGKNVVVAGIPNVAYSWRAIDFHWPNMASPADLEADFRSKVTELNAYNPYFMYWYKMECTPNAHTIVRGLGGLPGVIVSGCAAEKFDFVEDMAAATNYRLLKVLQDSTKIPFNFISTDYVNDEIIDRILSMNDMQQVGAGPMMLKEVLAGSRDNLLTDVRSDVRSERTSADTSSLSRGTGMTSLDMSMMSTDQQRTEVWESVM